MFYTFYMSTKYFREQNRFYKIVIIYAGCG